MNRPIIAEQENRITLYGLRPPGSLTPDREHASPRYAKVPIVQLIDTSSAAGRPYPRERSMLMLFPCPLDFWSGVASY